MAYDPALQLTDAGPACGVEVVVSVGVWGAHRSAVGHLIERRGRLDELVVVAFGAVVGLQAESFGQYQSVDVEFIVFEVVVDLEVARLLRLISRDGIHRESVRFW